MIRLSHLEISAIKSSIFKFDSCARIFLFGSRADPEGKGGDIDLLIFSQTLREQDKLKIKQELFKYLEEQKVDIIIAKNDTDPLLALTGKASYARDLFIN